MSGSKGRPQRPYKPSFGGEPIVGLYRNPDGRWKILATGERFTEPDERRAIQKYLAWKAKNQPTETVTVEGEYVTELPAAATVYTLASPFTPNEPAVEIDARLADVLARTKTAGPGIDLGVGYRIPEAILWRWFAKQLADRPEHVAKMTGIQEVLGLRHILPKSPITITAIVKNYRTHNPSEDQAKNAALAKFNELVDFCQAKNLDDLTTEKLLDWKEQTEKTTDNKGTKTAYYGRVRNVIKFGLKTGMDAVQIRAALDNCKVLWTPSAPEPHKPKPISREHFHKLLAKSNGWRSWMIVALNCCMSIEEVCGLRWVDFDLEAGTLACIRGKTKRKRIPRAAMLWPETIAELRKIKRRGPYVFISSHGTRYNRNTRVREFADLRKAAGLPEDVTFSCIRDGAFTVACHNTTDERRAKILAGHSCGMEDHYVLRNPQITAEGCAAVYAAYGPF